MKTQTRNGTIMMIAVLAAAAAARFYNLRHSPGWYHDETIFIGQAWNLIHGHFQWEAVPHTFLPHFPLFHLLLGPLLVFFGKDIIWIRFLAAMSGVGITWFIYKIGKEMENVPAGIIGAVLFALCPYTILLTRWGFTYSVAALLGVINLYFLVRHVRSADDSRFIYFASLAAGLGMVVAPSMWARFFVTLGVALFTVRRTRVLTTIVILLAPFAIYLGVMLLFARDIFVEEVNVLMTIRLASNKNIIETVNALGVLVGGLRPYSYLGFAGLFFLPNGNARRVVVFSLLLDLLLSLKMGDESFLYRVGIIFTPALFLSLGFLGDEIRKRTADWFRHEASDAVNYISRIRNQEIAPGRLQLVQKVANILAGFAGICFLFLIALHAYRQIQNYFPSMYAHFRLTTLYHTKAAERTAAWLRPKLRSDDLIITTHMEWMFNCHTASPMLVQLAEGGIGSGVYFGALRNRLFFPCQLKDARFAIIHEASPRIASIHKATPVLNRILSEWNLVRWDETIQVYANPHWK